MDERLAALAAAQHGVFSSADAHRCDVSASTVDRWVQAGRVVRVRRGLLVIVATMVFYYAVPVGEVPSDLGIVLSVLGVLGGLVFITDDARALYHALRERGVTDFTQEPTEHFYGTDLGLRDPFGNHIRILQQGDAAGQGTG